MATSSQSPATSGNSSDNSMRELASAIVMAMRQPKLLTENQQSVELKFRLIRNGLGNYGGHGDDSGDRALIRMVQTKNKSDRERSVLRFDDTLPSRAHCVDIYVHIPDNPQGTEQRSRIPLGDGDRHEISVGPHEITRVEVLDEYRVPIAAGIPVIVTDEPTTIKSPASTK